MNRRSFLVGVGSGIAISQKSRGYRGYKRKYEPLDTSFEIGAVYIPFIGDKFGSCIDNRHPKVGYYSMSDSEAVNYHIDVMQGHGISTLMYNFGEADPSLNRFRQFRKAELVDGIQLEVFWVINRIFQRNLDLEKYLDFMREELLSRENYNRYNKRPVIHCWAAAYLRWHDETREYIQNEYGGLDDFISYVKDRLSIGGHEPYLIAHEPNPGARFNYGLAFDGYTGWFGGLSRLGQATWDTFVDEKVDIAEQISEFVDIHDKEYIPMAVPGFDDRSNTCWGGDRYVPRSPLHLKEMLEFADEYRTLKRVNIATFNDWTEGHQIEPGEMYGKSYGTAYLETVKGFLQGKMLDDKKCSDGIAGLCLRE